jgi:hypothetical protein
VIYRVHELINDILERVILRLFAKPIIPSERVPDYKTAQDIVRAYDAHDSEGEKGEGDPEGEKRFVVD